MKIMKCILLIALFVSFISCSSHNGKKCQTTLLTAPRTLGEGFLYVNLHPDTDIPLYHSEQETTPIDTLRIRRAMNGTVSFVTTHLDKWLNPGIIYTGDSYEEAEQMRNSGLVGTGASLAFRVLAHDNQNWRVAIFENKDSTLYRTVVIKPTEEVGRKFSYHITTQTPHGSFGFQSWEDYLTKGLGTLCPENDTLTVYDLPNGQVIMRQNCDFLRTNGRIQIDGEWMKISELEKISSGWVRWREGEKLLLVRKVFLK